MQGGWFKRRLEGFLDGVCALLDWLDDSMEAIVFGLIFLVIIALIIWATAYGDSGTSNPPTAAQDANRVCRQHGGVKQIANSGELVLCLDGVAKETGY